MNKCYDLLLKIKQRPGVYVGKPSLERLSYFLTGFEISCLEYFGDENDCKIFNGFQEFIEQKYKLGRKTANHWSKIIDFFCIDDERAFNQFFIDFEEFQKTIPKI